mgnify:CR=1 FL=1
MADRVLRGSRLGAVSYEITSTGPDHAMIFTATARLGELQVDQKMLKEEVDEEVYIVEEGPDLPNDLFVARAGLGQVRLGGPVGAGEPLTTNAATSANSAATAIFTISGAPGASRVTVTRPSPAASVVPTVEGSTKRLRTSICMMRPAIPRDAPVRTSATVRGRRVVARRKASWLPRSVIARVSETSETPTTRLIRVSGRSAAVSAPAATLGLTSGAA